MTAEKKKLVSKKPVKLCLKNIPILKFRNDHNRPKGFLFGKIHVVLHACEDSWFHKKAYLKNRRKKHQLQGYFQ